MKTENSNHFTYGQLLNGVIILLTIFLRINAGPRIIDDSFITYRYARNILAGNGFVFNPGERVLGTTTPLYTLLLVFLSIPFGGETANFPLLSYLLNSAIDGVTCYLLYRFGKFFNKPLLGTASSLAFALAPYSVTFSIGGLETSLYVFLLTSTCYTYLRERFVWTSLLAAFAFLTRPDAMILILPLAIDYTLRTYTRLKEQREVNREKELKRFLRITSLFILPCLLWFSFSYLYFGSLFPNSIVAKALAYRLPENSALIRLLQHYATPFAEDKTFGKWGIAVGLFLYPSLALFGGIQLVRTTNRSLAMVIFPFLYFLIFSVANPLIFRWYLTPPLPFYMLCIFAGVIIFWEQVIKSLQTKLVHLNSLHSPILVFFTIIFPTLLILPAWQLHPSHGPNRLAPEMAFIQLELHYAEAAKFLESHAQDSLQNKTIAAGDVGVLGYMTEAKILDTVGLNSPQTLSYFPLEEKAYVINYAIPTRLILDELPDYIVFLEVYGRNTLLKNQEFLDSYRSIYRINTDIYGSEGLLIFEKK